MEVYDTFLVRLYVINKYSNFVVSRVKKRALEVSWSVDMSYCASDNKKY